MDTNIAQQPEVQDDIAKIRADLKRLIRRSSRRWRRLIIMEAVGLAIALPLAWLWIVFALDNMLHLPLWSRLIAVLLFVAVVVRVAWRMTDRFRQARFTEDQVALAIEREHAGGMENRLINTVQIPRGEATDNESIDFAAALLRENYNLLRKAELRQAAYSRRALITAALALLVSLGGIGFWRFRGDHFSNAATRLFMPFADVAPMYRTLLTVEPGDIELPPGQDIVLQIEIEGRRPDSLSIVSEEDGQRYVETVAVAPETNRVGHIFRNVENTRTYSVRGGDFRTPTYTISVLKQPRLHRIRTEYIFPEYTGKRTETVEHHRGDLEALYGTRARTVFTFDQAVDEVVMLVETVDNDADIRRESLERIGDRQFKAEFTFRDQRGYRLQTRQAERDPEVGPHHTLRVLADQPPRLRLSGVSRKDDIMIDSVMPLQISAGDDYGLLEVGLFTRQSDDRAHTDEVAAWEPVRTWALESGSLDFQTNLALFPTALAAAEGETIEIALRARDNNPRREGEWVDGSIHSLRFIGDEAELQRRYERILRAESALEEMIADQRGAIRQTAQTIRSFDPDSGLRWDDADTLKQLADAMKEQAAAQERLRRTAAQVARDMPSETDNLRISVGMLADTEMIRAIRIIESVPGRDSPAQKRTALADARLAMERTVRSLDDIHGRFTEFRRDWELANMISFVGMLAERQSDMANESASYGGMQSQIEQQPLRRSTVRRQQTVQRLCGLAHTAFDGLSVWIDETDPYMAEAFAAASDALQQDDLFAPMTKAIAHLTEGQWEAAAEQQRFAAEILAEIHVGLRIALAEAASRALAEDEGLRESDIDWQQEIDKLQAGDAVSPLVDAEGREILEEGVHMDDADRDQADASGEELEDEIDDRPFEEWMRRVLYGEGDQGYATLDDFTLGSTPSEEALPAPPFSDLPPSEVRPFLQTEFEDLVGELLDEADLLEEQYMTYNLISEQAFSEPGDPGKGGMPIGRTAASAPTGQEKPPTAHIGGASRSGRQGARSHGMTVGDKSVDRRGRDAVQEGHEAVPDQEGVMAYEASEDTQDDVSTGIGGKLVDHPDTHFSLEDSGEWTDDMVDRLIDPQEKHNIVEHQGEAFDHRVAALMRDMESQQEQVIERLKVIRKELTNLYLPTDHLDDVIARMEETLSRLDEPPDADLFRLQAQALDLLRGSVVVFHGAQSGHFPSIPRDAVHQGRILDEPPWTAIPGYESAVQRYYEKLAIP